MRFPLSPTRPQSRVRPTPLLLLPSQLHRNSLFQSSPQGLARSSGRWRRFSSLCPSVPTAACLGLHLLIIRLLR